MYIYIAIKLLVLLLFVCDNPCLFSEQPRAESQSSVTRNTYYIIYIEREREQGDVWLLGRVRIQSCPGI